MDLPTSLVAMSVTFTAGGIGLKIVSTWNKKNGGITEETLARRFKEKLINYVHKDTCIEVGKGFNRVQEESTKSLEKQMKLVQESLEREITGLRGSLESGLSSIWQELRTRNGRPGG